MGEKCLTVAMAGHIDHGKSTILGRLLAETSNLSRSKIKEIKEFFAFEGKEFKYAYLLDTLKDEQKQGITIDAARAFLTFQGESYVIIDVPGHTQFLKNMVTGTADADAAFIVIDALEGLQENTRRHAFMLSMLGLKQVAILINKMDLVGYQERIFSALKKECQILLAAINLVPSFIIPLSGENGDNITSLSPKMNWYQGITLIEALQKFQVRGTLEEKDLRFPVQLVYPQQGTDIIMGTVESGYLRTGDCLTFYPSEQKQKVIRIIGVNGDVSSAGAGQAVSLVLQSDTNNDLRRGEIGAYYQNCPQKAKKIRCKIFWLGQKVLKAGQKYKLEIGTAKKQFIVKKILKIVDASQLLVTETDNVKSYDVAECILELENPIAFDPIEKNLPTSKFVIIDDDIKGGGVVLEGLG